MLIRQSVLNYERSISHACYGHTDTDMCDIYLKLLLHLLSLALLVIAAHQDRSSKQATKHRLTKRDQVAHDSRVLHTCSSYCLRSRT